MLDIPNRCVGMRSGVLLGQSSNRGARQRWKIESPRPSCGGGVPKHDT
jgi:hypothetical protein